MPCDGDLNGRSGRNVLRPAATSQVFGAQDEPGKEGNVERRTRQNRDDREPAD